MKIEIFIFHRSPQAFNEYIVNGSAFSVHADSNIVLKQDARKLWAGELASLVTIEDFRLAVSAVTLHGMPQQKRRFIVFDNRHERI